MGDGSGIEWTDATWNPVTGCTKVSQGCKHCYAERVFSRPYPGRKFTDVQTHPDRLDQPLRWKQPRRIFVNSMSDLLHEDLPDEFIDKVFAVMLLAKKHTFQILTKRPERMRRYCTEPGRLSEIVEHASFEALDEWTVRGRSGKLPDGAHLSETANDPMAHGSLVTISGAGWPLPNVWLGVSVEDQKTADERIPLLLQMPAAVRFVSYEPALGPVNFAQWLTTMRCETCGARYARNHGSGMCGNCGNGTTRETAAIDWIIAGGESGPNARPAHPVWFRSARDQCQSAGVAFFFKQWGEWAPTSQYIPRADGADMVRVGKKAAGRLLDGREWSEFPASTPASAANSGAR